FAVREVVLDAAVRPLEAVHPELGPLQRLGGRLVVVRRAEDHERRVAEEDELAAGAQESRRLRDPLVRVGPDRRPVLGDREIERRVRQRYVLAERLDELEPETELLVAAPGRLELRRRGIDADHAGRAGLLQPRAEVRG